MRTYVRATVERRLAKIAASNHPYTETPLYTEIQFDLILAMDRGHFARLSRLCPSEKRGRLRLFLDFAPQFGIQDVPDPYYGGQDGFETVLDMIGAGCQGILHHIRETGR